jgi:hypothetical protein
MRQRQQLKTKKRRRQQFNTCNRYNKRCNSKIKTHNKRKGSHKRKRAQSGGTLTPEQLQLLRDNFAPRKPSTTTTMTSTPSPIAPPKTSTPPATTTTDQLQLLRDNFAPRKPPPKTPPPPPATPTLTTTTPEQLQLLRDNFAPRKPPQTNPTAMPASTTTTTRMTRADAFAHLTSPTPRAEPPKAPSSVALASPMASIVSPSKASVAPISVVPSIPKEPSSVAPPPTSASGALTPPNQTPYLRNPEIFVVNYVLIHEIQLMSNEIYRQDVRGRNLSKFAEVFHNWRVLQTVGDGNCLTHAFLQCLSPTYGKIWDPDPINNCPNKTAVARAFRLDFAKNSPLAVSKQAYNAGNGLTDLSDVQITDYSRLFNVITVVFEQKNINPSDPSPEFVNPIMAYNLTQYSKPHDKVIFIHGDGMHYSSILLPNSMFAMTLVEATTQIPELVRVLTPIGGFII